MSNGNGDDPLNHCGCCAPDPPLSPIYNRPGLSALHYRLGTYAVFLRRLLDAIHTSADPYGAVSLAALTTRSTDDPSISLLDAWATVADVLTFYQERIANEGYLRTATERRSVLEMARSIGYELAPGVAATVSLAFTVEEVIGFATAPGKPGNPALVAPGPGNSPYNRGIVDIPAGTQVQSVPAPGKLPQAFETSEDFQARMEWNAMRPRLSRLADLALHRPAKSNSFQLYLLGIEATFAGTGVSYSQLPVANVFPLNPATRLDPSASKVQAVLIDHIYVKGTSTNLSRGDRMIFVGSNGADEVRQVLVVERVDADSDRNQTRIAFVAHPADLPPFRPVAPPASLFGLNLQLSGSTVNNYVSQSTISEDDLQALGKSNSWDLQQVATVVNTPSLMLFLEKGVYAFRAVSPFFGHNAQRWSSLPKSDYLKGDPYPNSWDDPNWGLGRLVWTDSQGYRRSHADVSLERSFPLVRISTWAYFECPFATRIFRIIEVSEQSLADYGMSGKTTALRLDLQPNERVLGIGSPAAVTWGKDRLDVFAIDSDGMLHHHVMSGTKWQTVEVFGDNNLVNTPAVLSRDQDSLDVFAHTWDGHLYHYHWNGQAWEDPEILKCGFLTSSPSVVSPASNRLDVLSTGWDGNLYHTFWVGSVVSGPNVIGEGVLPSAPAAVSSAADRVDVIVNTVIGFMGHYTSLGPGVWVGPIFPFWSEVITGDFWGNPPSAISPLTDRIDLFKVHADGKLYTTTFFNAGWLSFDIAQNIGGSYLADTPAAVSPTAGELDVFTLGQNGRLYQAQSLANGPPSQWSKFVDLGGNFTGNPSAVSWGKNRIDIFTGDANGHLFHTWWDGKTWNGPEDIGGPNPPFFPVRSSTAYVQSEPLDLDALPVIDDIPAGSTSLMLNNLVPGLSAGQQVAVNGARADAPGLTGDEVVTLKNIVHQGGFTVLQFSPALQYRYLRESVTINANVTKATHGATVQEVLGSGDASKPNQTFVLKRPPLTYTSAATPSGTASTLEVRVNDLAWTEVPTLYGRGPGDEQYTVTLADDGKPTLTFGEPASRIRTGQNNVRVTYRTGIGLGGNVEAGSVSILLSRPPGLRGVSNPAPATGGGDPQNLADARVNAPLTVLTLDRIVSLEDYENFCRAFAGVGKAQAVELWSGETRMVYVTLAASNGDSINSKWPIYSTLIEAIRNSHDPVQQFRLGGYQALPFKLAAGVLVDRPRYEGATVVANVAAKLEDAFSFPNRMFAQAVTAAEIMALIQSVEGVVAADLTQLYLASDANGPHQLEPAPFLAAAPARWFHNKILLAQLLLLNPHGASLWELQS